MTDPILTKSTSHRDMPLTEAINTIENQRDRLVLYIANMPLLTKHQRDKIQAEVYRMNLWLSEYQARSRWTAKAIDQLREGAER